MRSEAMAVEDRAHELGDGVVGAVQRAVPFFERGWREQAAIEKGDGAKVTCRGRAMTTWGVECAEEERAQQALVQLPSVLELCGGVVQEKIETMIEPSFCFKKREEETAAGDQEGQLAPVGCGDGVRCWTGHAAGECADGALQQTVKAIRQRFPSQDVGEAGVAKQGVVLRHRREASQGVGVRIEHAGAIDAQRGHSWAVGVRADGGNAQRAACCVERDDAPLSRRGVVQHRGGQPFREFAWVGGTEEIGGGREFGADEA